MVVKKDGTRERFERSKLVAGLLKACEKRPIKPSDIDDIADRAEQILNDRPERETGEEDATDHGGQPYRRAECARSGSLPGA